MDRVVYLADGRAASGTTDQVVRTETLSRLYGHHVEVIHVQGRVLVVSGAEHQAHHPGDTDHVPRGALMLVAASWSTLFEPGFFSSGPVHVALDRGGDHGGRLRHRRGVHRHPWTIVRGSRVLRHRDRRRFRCVLGRDVDALRLRCLQRGRRRGHGAHRHSQAPRARSRDRHRAGCLTGLGGLVPLRGHRHVEHHWGHRERALRVDLHAAARHHDRDGCPRGRLGCPDRRACTGLFFSAP